MFAYFTLPETEGRSLEEIELHFSDDSKTLTDRVIAKVTTKSMKSTKSTEPTETSSEYQPLLTKLRDFEIDVDF